MDEEDGFRTQGPSGKSLSALAGEHLALLVPIIGAVVFVFRCVTVSSGDLYVAFIVATETSIGDAIRALLLTLVPFLLLISSYLVAFAASIRILEGNWRNLDTLGMVVASVALTVACAYLFAAFQTLGVLYVVAIATQPLVLTFGATAIEWRERRSRSGTMEGLPNRVRVPTSIMALIALWALMSVAWVFTNKTFWLPPERLAFQNEAPFTGYVLKTSEDHLVILNDRPRIIVEKPKATLQDRDFCYPEDHKARSSNVKSDAPTCP